MAEGEHIIDTGKGSFPLDQLGPLLPGMSEIMPQVGRRMWTCFYAGKARNRKLARFQLREAVNLMEKGAFLEPRYADTIENFIGEEIEWLQEVIDAEEWDRFEEVFGNVVARANVYHHLFERPFIRWKVPESPPADLETSAPDVARGI